MYRTVAQLDSLMGLLAAFFPQQCTRLELPETSVDGSTVYALRMRAGTGENRRGVLLVGGTHARELMNPDALAELAVDLIVSYLGGTDLVLGGRTWTAEDIKIILETLDLYLLFCSNPDGRQYVMTVDDLWRKNRRVNPGTPCMGVDLNRNSDILWGVTEGQTSCSPCADTYVGAAVFSEPETRNVRYLLDSYRIDCFVDVHSYSELVLYPWDHAPTQTADSSERFTILPTGTCVPIADGNYKEYMTPQDLQRFQTVAGRIVDAIAAVRGRVYTPEPSVGLYPTTGTLSDYAYSRHIADPNHRKVYGYSFETGPYVGNVPDSFHPADPEPIKREVKSGLLALIQQCICAIELIGSRLLGRDDEVQALRVVRDQLLGTTPAGREWILLFERVQTPLTGIVLADDRLARQAAAVVAAAGQLAANEEAILSRDEAGQAAALLDELEGRATEPGLRRDLRVVRAQLEHGEGRPISEMLRTLMAHGPEAGHGTASP
jgi:murein tripeptide amidase MpaA